MLRLMQYVVKQSLPCERETCVAITNVLYCRFEVTEFKFQPYYYVYTRTNTLGKGMTPLSIYFDSFTTVLQGWF